MESPKKTDVQLKRESRNRSIGTNFLQIFLSVSDSRAAQLMNEPQMSNQMIKILREIAKELHVIFEPHGDSETAESLRRKEAGAISKQLAKKFQNARPILQELLNKKSPNLKQLLSEPKNRRLLKPVITGFFGSGGAYPEAFPALTQVADILLGVPTGKGNIVPPDGVYDVNVRMKQW